MESRNVKFKNNAKNMFSLFLVVFLRIKFSTMSLGWIKPSTRLDIQIHLTTYGQQVERCICAAVRVESWDWVHWSHQGAAVSSRYKTEAVAPSVPLWNLLSLSRTSLAPKMENGSILLAPQMRHILASLNNVGSAADGHHGIQKEA